MSLLEFRTQPTLSDVGLSGKIPVMNGVTDGGFGLGDKVKSLAFSLNFLDRGPILLSLFSYTTMIRNLYFLSLYKPNTSKAVTSCITSSSIISSEIHKQNIKSLLSK